ncbi:hypothetical protein [Hyphomicrobium sp.]|jgi:hypothetical protein|uniref:hypothetical protein n=1 Tax=Hyphomicrobium sp. TaxID=82 RepID=UPI003569FB29
MKTQTLKGFSSANGQVDIAAYQRSQQEMMQRQQAERSAQAEQQMIEAARQAQHQREQQQQQLVQQQNEQRQRDAQAQADRDRYTQELFRIMAPAYTQPVNTPHPQMSGATAGVIFSCEVKPRDWTAQQNAQQPIGSIPNYNTNSPALAYSTTIPTTDVVRAHHVSNEPGPWATRAADINHGHLSGDHVQRILALKDTPTHVSDVNVPIGTFVVASRPISGEAQQFNLAGNIGDCFRNSRPLG